MGSIGVIFLFFTPESPRFYHSNKRFDDCRKSFMIIAKFNGVDPSIPTNFIFKEELPKEVLKNMSDEQI